MLRTLKLNNKKQKKSSFYEENSLVGLTPEFNSCTIYSGFKTLPCMPINQLNINIYFTGSCYEAKLKQTSETKISNDSEL